MLKCNKCRSKVRPDGSIFWAATPSAVGCCEECGIDTILFETEATLALAGAED